MKKVGLIGLVSVVIIGILAAVGFKLYDNYQEKHRESEIVMPLDQYYQVPAGEAMVIFDESIYEKNAIYENNAVYLDLDTVLDRFGIKLFMDETENRLYYTNAEQAFVFTPDSAEFLLNRQTVSESVPLVIKKNGIIYISLKFLSDHTDITYSFYENPARLLLTWSKDSFLCAGIKEKTSIRVSQDIKADLLKTLEPGETVRFIDGGGIQENGFVKVMSTDGVRGYILSERLDESFYTDPIFNSFTPVTGKPQLCGERVYLGWHLLYTSNGVDLLKAYLEDNEDLTVVAPTWYFLNDTKGNFISYADGAYVQYAHSQGVKVWVTVKNDNIDGVFECTADSYSLLTSYESRIALVDRIIEGVKACGADGVNIDFELLSVASGVYFVQFLRELSLECRKEGIILSVDNYVPENYNAYYDIKSQAEFADYIVIMGYDEHYAGSEEAGSVSSLEWFKRAADNTLAKCPAEQIIMGVPFYTRLWKEVKDGENVKVTVESTPTLSEAARLAEKLDVEKVWRAAEGQYYIEYDRDGATYKMWIEDNESLCEKAKAIRERGIGGIAAWKLGDELDDTWNALWEALDGALPEENASDVTG